jgi:hypothetical protein
MLAVGQMLCIHGHSLLSIEQNVQSNAETKARKYLFDPAIPRSLVKRLVNSSYIDPELNLNQNLP